MSARFVCMYPLSNAPYPAPFTNQLYIWATIAPPRAVSSGAHFSRGQHVHVRIVPVY